MGDVVLFSVHDTAPNTRVVLHPAWSLREERHSRAAALRTLDGQGLALPWAAHTRLRLPLRHVPSATRDTLHALWQARAPVGLTLDSSHTPSTVLGSLANLATPLDALEPAYADRWQGEVVIESRDAARAGGMPFLLDDAALGLLDQAHLSLG